jgi:PIN domain nuclease of toxin-antitoxin system
MKYVIDTHALIWFLEGNERLGPNALSVLSDPESVLILPAIALAEALWIIERGKTSIPSVQVFMAALRSDSRITFHPLDQSVITETMTLLSIHEMHDRQIVSTAIVLQKQGELISLLSCDRNITAANVIPIVW